MNMKVMVCGVDCHQGDKNCNGYCTGKADHPNDATEAQKIEFAQRQAFSALHEAEKAWHTYAGLLDVGPDRTRAFAIYELIRTAPRRAI